jgi:hypothetical protein
MKQNGVTEDNLSHVFHIDGGAAEVIAGEAPGKSDKEKTLNAFVLTGLAEFLQTGDPKFDDKAARALCKKLGCFGEGNHATYMKDRGNLLGGSKEGGWTLTGPGLKAGAELIKGMAGA